MMNKHRTLLNFRKYQQQVFWDSYSQSECNKDNNTFNKQSITTTSTTTNPLKTQNPPTTLMEALFSYYQTFISFYFFAFSCSKLIFVSKQL